ncbi:MAG TPA: flagellar motor switch protein FliN [Candidatus Acidoferrales bacterium]|nr:flagellar motor switch protein FliN [Candidatus Acidoferrales bacterium]
MADEKKQASEIVKQPKESSPSAKSIKDPAFENLSDANRGDSNGPSGKENKIDLLLDLNLNVSVELGKTSMVIKDILELGRGSIIEFDKLVSEPVDILVNGRKMAEGEVVVVDKHFGIRITSMVDPVERLKGLKK